MGSITNDREAVLAATFVRRSKLTNKKAIANLGRFATELELFSHGREDTDEWDDYQNRLDDERKADDTSEIVQVSLDAGMSPMDVCKARHAARLEQRVEENQPILKIAQPDPVAFTDPNSVDYRDPNDFFRTSLIKAAIDNDIMLVQELVEKQGASLFVRDIEGNDACQNAINFGNDEAAFYLERAKADRSHQKPQIKVA